MNFWQAHGTTAMGVLFLICIAIFPRITMLFAVATPFGWLAWVGWVFAPHLTVAILATTMYWHTNPVLCVIAWIVALTGTSAEGATVKKASS